MNRAFAGRLPMLLIAAAVASYLKDTTLMAVDLRREFLRTTEVLAQHK